MSRSRFSLLGLVFGIFIALMFVALLPSRAHAQASAPLTNDDVIKMVPDVATPFGATSAQEGSDLPHSAALNSTQNRKPEVQNAYGRLPLSFEPARGQTDPQVKFLARGPGYTLFLTSDEAVFVFKKEGGGSRLPGRRPMDPAYQHSSGPLSELKDALLEPVEWFGRRGLFGLADGLIDRNDPHWPPNQEVGDQVTGDSPGVLRMKLVGANSAANVEGLEELPGKSNYFIGNDPKKWVTNVPTYRKVTYKGVFPGVDMVYYGNQRQLEYDLVVAPGADPNQIRFALAGVTLQIDSSGDLLAHLEGGDLRWHKPFIYQPVLDNGRPTIDHGQRTANPLQGQFILESDDEISFRIANYDKTKTVIIDPTLSYSTYLGGSGDDSAKGIAADVSGSVYVAGYTVSNDFPLRNPLEAAYHGYADAFVTKLDPSGSSLVYSTYLGGSNSDWANGIAVDASGNAYITGPTTSTDFPTQNPFQASLHGNNTNAFVSKIDASGSVLVYSTYLGGSGGDWGNGIAVDASGNAYVTGETHSTDFPTQNPLQPSSAGCPTAIAYGCDAFVTKLNAMGSALVYSTYLGGGDQDEGISVAVDASGNAYVTGVTASSDFPMQNPFQASNPAKGDAFVSKLSASGSTLVYSTYIGGSAGAFGAGIAVDVSGNAYITGYTASSDFPVQNPLQPSIRGYLNAFVTKFDISGSALVYSTYLGGSYLDLAHGIAIDASGNAYVTGTTQSSDFPTQNAIQASFQSTYDGFVSELNASCSALIYSTFLGGSTGDGGGFAGIAVDSSGNTYVAGDTDSTDFPTVDPVQASNAGGGDVIIAKISPSPVPPTTGTVSVTTNSSAATFTITGPATFSGSGTSATFDNAPVGTYTISFGAVGCYMTPSASSGTLSAGVTLTFQGIYSPAPPTLMVSPATLSFSYQAGSGSSVPSQNLTISSVCGAVQVSTQSTNHAWLTSTQPGGFTPLSASVAVAPGLSPGTYSAQLIVSSPGAANSPLNVPVALTVSAGPSAGLVFPVKVDATYCNGTASVCGPETATIETVFDHSMTHAYESNYNRNIIGKCVQGPKPLGYGTITDFENEIANVSPWGQNHQPPSASIPSNGSNGYGACGTLYGYTNTTTTGFLSSLNYQGSPSTYLWYDGHPGYDYLFNFGTPVYPAISGCITYKLSAAGASPANNYHTLAIIPQSANPPGGCEQKVKTTTAVGTTTYVGSETGYVVFYLHLASYPEPNGNVVYCASPPASKNKSTTCKNPVPCPNCPKEGTWVSVDTVNPIGYTGNFDKYWGGVGPHLHFEVDHEPNPSQTATPIPLDPYGWWSVAPDPYTTYTGIVNTWLWK